MSRQTIVMAAAILFLAPAAVFAQTGCENSPECPTVVLGLVGAASAVFTASRASLARARRNRNR